MPVTFLKGLYAAKLYIAAPVLLALVIMAAFGEGDYILAILTVLYSPESEVRFIVFWQKRLTEARISSADFTHL